VRGYPVFLALALLLVMVAAPSSRSAGRAPVALGFALTALTSASCGVERCRSAGRGIAADGGPRTRRALRWPRAGPRGPVFDY
jgi:hypothetical protein